MQPATGMVSTQAQTISTVTPHRTALSRRVVPNPTIEPAMVWVVLTGMPAAAVAKSVTAAPDSAQKPPKGSSLVILEPIVLTIRQPPIRVPRPMAVWQTSTIQNRNLVKVCSFQMLAIEQHGDDAHRLLGVVRAMSEAVEGGGAELSLSEQGIDASGGGVAEEPGHADAHHEAEHQPDQGREDNEGGDLQQSRCRITAPKPALAMAAPARPPIRACEELVGSPRYHVIRFHKIGPQQAAEDHVAYHTTLGCTTPLPDRHRHVGAEHVGGHEIEERGPDHGLQRRETRVETTVAIELAASWIPLVKSNRQGEHDHDRHQ